MRLTAWILPRANHHRLLRLALPAAAAAIFAAFHAPSPAKAEIDYPYCIKVFVEGGPYTDCSFSTQAQCQASASGRSALCYRDPFYPGAPGSASFAGEPRGPSSSFDGNPTPAPHHKHHKKKKQPT